MFMVSALIDLCPQSSEVSKGEATCMACYGISGGRLNDLPPLTRIR